MTLREMMARHARTVLTRPDHFGEEWTYHPVGSSGLPPVTVRAVIDRLLLDSPGLPRSSGAGTLTATAFLSRSSTWENGGIAQWRPGDQMEGPMRIGGADVLARVDKVIEEDEASLLVMLIA